MSEQPTPTPEPVKPRKPRSTISRAYASSLEKSGKIADAALSPLYNATLVAGGITPAFISEFALDVGRAREFLTGAVAKRGERENATLVESAERRALVRLLQVVQSRALQKFHESAPDRPRAAYGVGTTLQNASDAILIQVSTGVIEALKTDALPGITPAIETEIAQHFAAWQESIESQGEIGGGALTTFAQFKQLNDSLELRRITLCYAADADFPYFDALNHAARGAFQLPLDQPYRAPKR